MTQASLVIVTRIRRPPPPPLEANDELVTAIITAGWAVALVVLVLLRDQLPADERWWIWTCLAGLLMGLFALWYVPRLKRARARSAARRQHGP
jgi:multisubunit Na+/H+ antiporter MnhE subunit